MEYYSTIKINKIMPFAGTWMDLEIIILKEVKQRQNPCITHMWNLKKMIEMNLQNRNRLTDIENTLMATKGKGGGRAVKQVGRG